MMIEHTIYPLTIVLDRYNGVYSGGLFTAWNLRPDQVPWQIGADDCTCWDIWETLKRESETRSDILFGVGSTPIEAEQNLANKINSLKDGNGER